MKYLPLPAFQMVWNHRHGLITEENPDPPTNKGLISIFHYQFDQVVAIKSEEITNIQNSTKIKYKVQIHSLTPGSNFEDNIKIWKKLGGFSFAKAF